ncbi:MAG: 23S rRNA (adenine(2503)-C(2))-methyltransferase RlmN [Anaerolineales bacterium]|nr:23S rRNA (adenine(2503)-C(2))-methyltransferase RlmN [Anaerolineales bacterium]
MQFLISDFRLTLNRNRQSKIGNRKLIDLLNLNKNELRDFVASLNEPTYRAAQIERWLCREFVTDFGAMTDLPRDLRTRLNASARVSAPRVIAEHSSADGWTRKALLQLDDGQTIEAVLMLYPDAPAHERRTVCISTQVGCPIGCPFCATGQAGYIRNLTPGEIVAQVLHFARAVAPETLTNVVMMGMGEPFMKFDITWQAIASLTDPARFGMGARRITVSTSGEIPGIERLTREQLQINLAISLHAPDDKLRNVLVPLNRKYPLRDLMRTAHAYAEQTRRRVTFEYALMDGVNDKPQQARALARMLRGGGATPPLLCHVNLIPLNPTRASPYRRSPDARVLAFEKILRDANIPTTLRVERGIEIAAGCGQLRQKIERQ